MGWLHVVGSLKVSFAEYRLFYRALLQKRPMILKSLLIVATPYMFATKELQDGLQRMCAHNAKVHICMQYIYIYLYIYAYIYMHVHMCISIYLLRQMRAT